MWLTFFLAVLQISSLDWINLSRWLVLKPVKSVYFLVRDMVIGGIMRSDNKFQRFYSA